MSSHSAALRRLRPESNDVAPRGAHGPRRIGGSPARAADVATSHRTREVAAPMPPEASVTTPQQSERPWGRHFGMITTVKHPSGIPEKIVSKVVARRGRLHAFESIDPRTTALVVIDLDEATVGNDDTSQHMITTINALAHAVRQSGGVVAWVFSRMDAMPKHFTAILGHELATRYVNNPEMRLVRLVTGFRASPVCAITVAPPTQCRGGVARTYPARRS
jgi:hypothetical protein